MATWTSLTNTILGGLSLSSFATDLDDNLYVMNAAGDVYEYKISTDATTKINSTGSMNIDSGIVWFNGDLYMLADRSGSPEVFRWDGSVDSRTSVEVLPTSDQYWLLEDGTTMVAVPLSGTVGARYTTDGTSWSTGGNMAGDSFWLGFPRDIDTRGKQIRVLSFTTSGSIRNVNKWGTTSWSTEVNGAAVGYNNEYKTDEDFDVNGRYWDSRGSIPVRSSTDFVNWTGRDNSETGEYTFYLDEYGLFTKTYGVNGDVGFGGTQCEFCEFNEGTELFDAIDTAFNHAYTASIGQAVPLINIPSGATSAGTYMILYSSAFVVWKRSEALPETTATIWDLSHSAGGMPGSII